MTDRVDAGLRVAIIRAARTASAAGLMPANQGNLSARDGGSGLILITPHNRPYDSMVPADLVVADQDGNIREGKHEPSADLLVHCTVYRKRLDVGAVMHTEPPYVNALGTLGDEIEPVTTTGLKSANGTIQVMPFRFVRDVVFAQDMLVLMSDRFAVVWGNHGLLVVAPSIEQALDRSLGVESNAQVLAISRLLGKPRSLGYVDAKMVVA